jgi:hypothetical protein
MARQMAFVCQTATLSGYSRRGHSRLARIVTTGSRLGDEEDWPSKEIKKFIQSSM